MKIRLFVNITKFLFLLFTPIGILLLIFALSYM